MSEQRTERVSHQSLPAAGSADDLRSSSHERHSTRECTEPTSTPASAPPLQIAHLLLFTACSAVYLVLLRSWIGRATLLGDRLHDLTLGLLAAEAMCVGPAIGTVFLRQRWRARGYQFPCHGGEWLLVIFAWFSLLDALARVLMSRATDSFGPLVFYGLCLLAGLVALCGVMFWLAASARRLPTRWRVFYGVKASVLALVALSFVEAASLVLVLAELVTLSIVAGIDSRSRQRLPWTHWLGIAVCWLNGAILLSQHTWLTYLR
jgi:hypothetical protein